MEFGRTSQKRLLGGMTMAVFTRLPVKAQRENLPNVNVL